MISITVGERTVPQLGQGTWQMGDAPPKRKGEIAALRRGIELGMTAIDTAEMYGDGRSETLVGEAIAGLRDQVYLVSKVLPSNASAKGTIRSCEASLKRLGVDTLDLYLLHWRGRHPLAETVEAFTRLRQEGKIQAWGVSNFDVNDMEELLGIPHGMECAANQVIYNPEYRGIEFDLLPWCRQHRIAVTAYSPVGQGGDLLQSPVLRKIAKDRGLSAAQVALAWCLRQPVLAIPKAGSVGHMEENAAAALVTLAADELATIDKAFGPPLQKQRLATL